MEITEIIIGVVWLCAAIGIISFGVALRGVNRETGKLTPQLRNEILGDNAERHARRKALEEWLKKEQGTSAGVKHEVRVGQGRHLLLRMKTLFESVNRTEAQVIPSLHDLHTLTLQDEMSRCSSMWLRTITAFLLIVGICGTLLGVHDVVGGIEQLSPGALRPALEPSMLAVFCTVVLMWLRGLYVARLDNYLEKLDLFTMTEVIPLMQPVSGVGGKTIDLSRQIHKLNLRIDSVQRMAQSMQELSQSVKQSAGKVSSISGRIHAAYKSTQSSFDGLLQHLDESEKRMNVIGGIIGEGEKLSSGFTHSITELSRQNETLKEACRNAHRQYGELSSHLTTISDEVLATSEMIQLLEQNAKQLSEMGDNITGYEQVLRSVNEGKLAVEQVMTSMADLRRDIESSTNAAYNSLEEARKAQLAAAGIAEKLETHNTDFKDHVTKGEQEVRETVSGMKQQLEGLRKKADDLQKKFRQRSEKLHLN